YDEPILIKQNDRIKTIKIGKFIDLYYSKDEHGIPKPAEKVEVLAFDQETLKINWRPITYVFRHTYEKPLHKLTLESGREIKITPGHSVFIFRDSKIVTVPSDQLKEGDFVIIPKRLPSNTIEITEINLAHELLRLKITRGLFLHNVPMSVFSRLSKIPRHWINFKKLPLEFAHQLKNDELRYCTLKCKGGSPSGVPTFIPVSKELLRLLGYYIAEGSLFISSSRSHLLSFCFNKKETHFIEEVKNIIFTLFKQTVSILPDRNASKVNVGNRLIYHLLHDVLNVGHSAHTKKIPDIVFNVTTDLKKQFLDAWFNGDAGVTVSRELISDVLYLLLTCGIIGTVGRDEKERTALLNGRPITSHGYYKLVSPATPTV
ncbi:hypothetical protein J4450_00445, partial [Candidatus Micrarchaeota archaeon]|nr:hypothetical protein [Candidatus Micrarchaeota archaeon]